jgi:hypothetical protein
MKRTVSVFETSDLINLPMRLSARENFIEFFSVKLRCFCFSVTLHCSRNMTNFIVLEGVTINSLKFVIKIEVRRIVTFLSMRLFVKFKIITKQNCFFSSVFFFLPSPSFLLHFGLMVITNCYS